MRKREILSYGVISNVKVDHFFDLHLQNRMSSPFYDKNGVRSISVFNTIAEK